jgi:thiol-disulfide isomerase/thioredoxin
MNKVNIRRVVVAAACVLALFAGAGYAQSPTAPPLPRLVVTTLGGKTFNLAAERGRWVIVNFWATWCGPCIEEMPAISRFVASHKNVTAIGLAWDNSPRADVVKFAKKHPVDYPLAQVPTDRAPGGFPAPLGLPTTYLIAPDGRIAKPFVGPVTAKLLAQAIAEATAAASEPSPRPSGK